MITALVTFALLKYISDWWSVSIRIQKSDHTDTVETLLPPKQLLSLSFRMWNISNHYPSVFGWKWYQEFQSALMVKRHQYFTNSSIWIIRLKNIQKIYVLNKLLRSPTIFIQHASNVPVIFDVSMKIIATSTVMDGTPTKI